MLRTVPCVVRPPLRGGRQDTVILPGGRGESSNFSDFTHAAAGEGGASGHPDVSKNLS